MLEHIEIQEKTWTRPSSPTPSEIQLMIAKRCGVAVDELLGKGGGARVMFARQTTMYLMHVVYGFSLTEIAASFGRNRATASEACHRIEDLRDDARFDRHLTELEELLRSAGENGVRP